jgi:hypothetical protein
MSGIGMCQQLLMIRLVGAGNLTIESLRDFVAPSYIPLFFHTV